LFLAAASYVFYGWWDVRFLFLIFGSTLLDYSVGLLLSKEDRSRNRKLLLALSIAGNLGILGFYKYCNFFIENFNEAFTLFGSNFQVSSLNLILPVGISFYTFQTMSYTIDVYRKQLQPTKDFIAFSAFVSFFPQLVAGPIERASNLLPQILGPRKFEYQKAADGARQILWGFFKKLVIADGCAAYANDIFAHSDTYSGSTLVLGAILFAFQIYGDFSGYSDIAIGLARMFGFHLMRNFAFPYFSRDIAEFWRRWHISLSTWFRDYLYIPLGGSKGSRFKVVRNVFIIFIVSGFWHGANWTFIAWGALNAAYFLPLLLLKINRSHLEVVAHHRFLPSLKEIVTILITFGLTVVAWIFFRADTVSHALHYLRRIFSSSLISVPEVKPVLLIVLILFLIVLEWIGRRGHHALEGVGNIRLMPVRWSIYWSIAMLTFLFASQQQDFIYFQF
jgi:D-alanyl-lipoteichoic acid acyltransferase DltB (MBOAT superfamily)